ncbi:hypothetical protein ACSBR1_013931 [Camellia fascicularis]
MPNYVLGKTVKRNMTSESMERYKDLDVARLTVLRTDQSRVLDGVSRCISTSSTLEGEAHAIRLACFLADAHNLQQVEIEDDNRTIILLSVSEKVPPWEVGVLLRDIKTMASRCNFSFRWNPRHTNKVAHWLAKAALSGDLGSYWVVNPPAPLAALLSFDSSSS